MNEKQLKTNVWQRIIIIVVAILLLGSTVLTYMFIVMSGNNSKQSQEDRISELSNAITAKSNEIEEAAKPLSSKYFKEFEAYKKQIKSYNVANANNEKLKVEDLKEGTGKQLAEDDSDYSAYYIGWCGDGSIFDSSFSYAEDDTDKTTPTGLQAPLISPSSVIEGWKQGVVGMKLGGVRQISIPGELAYGDTRSDICGQKNAPLKFIVMALPTDETLGKLNKEWNELFSEYYALLMGSQQ